ALRTGVAAAVFAACAAVAPANAATEEKLTIGGVDAVVWSAQESDVRRPVVVFSHAMHMCPTQSRYLTQALARAGYLVIAPRHATPIRTARYRCRRFRGTDRNLR
ncbi:MAG TPA: hypothetical protein VNE58_10910, partial [Casimicrobiaceae bacterium]|nr:hypothetical protein [Casimicrobiaceae bacterium]